MRCFRFTRAALPLLTLAMFAAPPAHAATPEAPAAASVTATRAPTMAAIPVFFMERTDRVQVSLRRFTYTSDKPCRATAYGHDATCVILRDAPASAWGVADDHNGRAGDLTEMITHDDPRWPAECEACGEPFHLDDMWQVNVDRLYAGGACPDCGTSMESANGCMKCHGCGYSECGDDRYVYTLRDAPAGAAWDMVWMHGIGAYTGPDGLALCVRTPGGDWYVDSRASNCTRPGDDTHRCWVRHGDPRDPQGLVSGVKLHVDKNGDTCAAGAGSIIAGGYHGFLHHGRLTSV